MGKEGKNKVRKALFDTVERQIRENNPKETRAAFDRLVDMGHSPEEAKRLIALVLVNEMSAMLHSGRPFDQASYRKAVSSLPRGT